MLLSASALAAGGRYLLEDNSRACEVPWDGWSLLWAGSPQPLSISPSALPAEVDAGDKWDSLSMLQAGVTWDQLALCASAFLRLALVVQIYRVSSKLSASSSCSGVIQSI